MGEKEASASAVSPEHADVEAGAQAEQTGQETADEERTAEADIERRTTAHATVHGLAIAPPEGVLQTDSASSDDPTREAMTFEGPVENEQQHTTSEAVENVQTDSTDDQSNLTTETMQRETPGDPQEAIPANPGTIELTSTVEGRETCNQDATDVSIPNVGIQADVDDNTNQPTRTIADQGKEATGCIQTEATLGQAKALSMTAQIDIELDDVIEDSQGVSTSARLASQFLESPVKRQAPVDQPDLAETKNAPHEGQDANFSGVSDGPQTLTDDVGKDKSEALVEIEQALSPQPEGAPVEGNEIETLPAAAAGAGDGPAAGLADTRHVLESRSPHVETQDPSNMQPRAAPAMAEDSGAVQEELASAGSTEIPATTISPADSSNTVSTLVSFSNAADTESSAPAASIDTKEDQVEDDSDTPAPTVPNVAPVAVDTTTASLKSSTPVLQRMGVSGVKGQTMVGGMLASKKAMKPFRSPIIARKDPSGITASPTSTNTPTKSLLSTSKLQRPTSLLARSAMSDGASTSTSSTAPPATSYRMASTKLPTSHPALNKPFKSLFVKKPPSGQEGSPLPGIEDIPDVSTSSMTSLQLSAALPKLERRLALLKDAKRHLQAQERDLDNADNTDHIRELGTKWLEKGREAAEMLWELVKDKMQNAENDGETAAFESNKGDGFNNWGWDDPASVGRTDKTRNDFAGRRNYGWSDDRGDNFKRSIQEEIDSLNEEDRQELYRSVEAEGSLPEIDPKTIVPARKRRRMNSDEGPQNAHLSRGHATGDGNNDISDTEYDMQADDDEHQPATNGHDQDNDGLSPTTHDERSELEQEAAQEAALEASEDPRNKGMAKMLIQCGIDLKTFQWDAAAEEWIGRPSEDE